MKYIIFLFVSILFTQCSIEEIITAVNNNIDPVPVDTTITVIDTIPVDTAQPVVLACDTVVTQPEFITIYIEYFNGAPAVEEYYYHVSQGNDVVYDSLHHLLIDLGYHPDSITVYQEGNSVAAIIRGTNDKSLIENKIWTLDAIGQHAFFVANIQSFLFGGALTYEEYRQVAIELPSVRTFNFRNTNWTQEQYEEVATIILGECKLGRHDANFMFNAQPISCSLYCKFIERGWLVVRGQSCTCTPEPKPIWIAVPLNEKSRA